MAISPGTQSTTDKVWVLEASGAAVRDTAVIFAAAAGRTIVLQHPDDRAIFLILHFPAAHDSTRSTDSIRVDVHPLAGKYEVTLDLPANIPAGSTATFSYAMHFRTPAAAVATHRSPGQFEQLLAPAVVTDTRVKFLEGTRVAADMMRFPLTTAGTYALVALR
jgi:hypothetical protein